MASKRKTVSDSAVSAGAAAAPARAKIGRRSPTSDSPAVEPVSANPATAPSFEQIAQLAYSYWQDRGYQNGSPEDDWLRAERELRTQPSSGVSV